MGTDYKRKLLATVLTAVLVFSSFMFLTGAQAGAADDLEVRDLYEPPGTPPPRVNTVYDIIVKWKNLGDTDSYVATIRLYSDCSQNDLASESGNITMGPGDEGSETLSVTFTEVGETCYSATIYYDSVDYGEYENYLNVEPETGEADLWVSFDCNNCLDSDHASQGEEVDVTFEYGNDGDVSTLNPVTFMGYFDPLEDNTSNYFEPSPLTFDFLSPPPPEAPPEGERMEWPYTIPTDIDDGRYKFTVFIDSEQDNTDEDPDLDNNMIEWEMCIGDCTEPDLKVWDNGIDSIRSEPIEPIAGNTVTFTYFVENIGEGSADPPGPFDEEDGELVMHLEVMKCPNEDCTGQLWVFVNQSNEVRTPIAGGEVFESDAILGMNWSTTDDDSGFWNVRILVDGEDVIEETDEGNNVLDWFKVYDGYFELKEQRPDLIITGIDEGSDKIYQDDSRTIQVAVTQSLLGDKMVDNVELFIKITDPELTVFDWFKIDEPKTVGFEPDTTFFDYDWTPSKLGVYEFEAWVDKENNIPEWDDTNNEYVGTKYIEVFEKLPDLQIVNIEVSPLNEDNYGKVGVSSNLMATIANLGVRDMTSSEGSKLEVTFYTAMPLSAELDTITVGQVNGTLAVGETVDVSIPFRFSENSQYRIVVKVDEEKLIPEENELNNENYKNIYAVSSMDAYVSNLTVSVDDGLAGKDHPITFVIGMHDVPEEGKYRVHFNVSANGFGGYGGKMVVAMVNSTGVHVPIGTGYEVSGPYGFVDFSSTYSSATVTLPWIPSATRSDDYVVLVEVDSVININSSNDEAKMNVSIEKLTTNIVLSYIKVTDSDGSASIKVKVDYPQGEQDALDVVVRLQVWRGSDYDDYLAGNNEVQQIENLTDKTVTGIMRGQTKDVTFTWAITNAEGTYVFVAIADPDNTIKETDKGDNSRYISASFGDTGPSGSNDEEDEGFLDSLLPAPSVVTAMALLGIVALTRRRS